MSRYYIIPIFVPHLGCPHDCVFCNQKRITGLSTDVTKEDVRRIIEEHLKTFKEDATVEVAFFGGSFTAIDIDVQSELLSVPYEYKSRGLVDKIRMSTRPDAIDRKILTNLKKYSVDIIELGVQSTDELVLEKSGRGHSSEDMRQAFALIRSFDIEVGLQMMLGLPGDNFTKSYKTAEEFVGLDPYCVRIYPTLVIKDTYLEKIYLNGQYSPLELEDAVEQTSKILMLFKANNIDVIRIGLQPTDNIQMGKDVVAGPFHPSFRQLVESKIISNIIQEELDKLGDIKESEIRIYSSNRNISYIVGQKGVNKKILMEKYKLKKIINIGMDISDDLLRIEIGENYIEVNISDYVKSFNN